MKFIDEVDLKNKVVILRVDYNVPINNNKIVDKFRIISSFETIKYLLKQDCKIIILSHLGKVKTESDKKANDMKIVYKALKNVTKHIYFSNECNGSELTKKVKKLKKKDMLLVQNTRYMDVDKSLESNCDEELSKYWALLGDVFVMDAFGTCHREHASTYGISKYLPTCYGFLIKKEIKVLDEVIGLNNKTLILGGAKVSDKIDLIDNLIDKSEKVLIGGKMCLTFLKATGNKIDKSLIEEDKLDYVNKLLKENKEKIVLPIDLKTDKNENKLLEDITESDNILDIGEETITLFKKKIDRDNLVVWNGPMGYIEDKNFQVGTLALLRYLNNYDIKTVIAGGDTASVANKYNFNFYHISTGGGATLKYLEGKELKALGGKFNEANSIK